jgi:hypothetical protein
MQRGAWRAIVTITDLMLVDDSGRSIAASATSAERKLAFPPLGILNVTKLRWLSGGTTYELSLVVAGKKSSWELLPDQTGILVTNEEKDDASRATIVNADGSIRFELKNPWPQHPKFSKGDRYGFSYPTTEKGQPGVVVYVWRAAALGSGVASEHFYGVDPQSGEYLVSHPVY